MRAVLHERMATKNATRARRSAGRASGLLDAARKGRRKHGPQGPLKRRRAGPNGGRSIGAAALRKRCRGSDRAAWVRGPVGVQQTARLAELLRSNVGLGDESEVMQAIAGVTRPDGSDSAPVIGRRHNAERGRRAKARQLRPGRERQSAGAIRLSAAAESVKRHGPNRVDAGKSDLVVET